MAGSGVRCAAAAWRPSPGSSHDGSRRSRPRARGRGEGGRRRRRLHRLIEKTHQESGCLAYALHRDNADPAHLVLIERWRSQEDLDAHMTQPYVADLFAAAGTPGMLAAAPELAFLSPLGIGDPAKAPLG